MRIFREGIGIGAEKQYRLLSPHWNRAALPNCYLYWNAFTRDRERLVQAKRRGIPIISRVGGWHFGESEEATAWVLSHSDAAIFVSRYTQRLAKQRFGHKLPERQAVIINSAKMVKHRPLADPPYLLVRAGGLGWPIWKRHMLSRSLSVVALWRHLPSFRGMYPGLTIKVVGRADEKLKRHCAGEGVEFLPYTADEGQLHDLGSRAAALVHLIIGDYGPNTVCEIIGEGRPAIVFDLGGAGEVAGRAGVRIIPVAGHEGGPIDIWYPLDGHTYRPSEQGLTIAVRGVIEDHRWWRKQARKRAGEIAPEIVARRYADFIEESCD